MRTLSILIFLLVIAALATLGIIFIINWNDGVSPGGDSKERQEAMAPAPAPATHSPNDVQSERILESTPSGHSTSDDPSEQAIHSTGLSAPNPACTVTGRYAQLQIREVQGGVVVYTPWANFLLPGLSTDGLAGDPLITIAGSGSSSGGSRLGEWTFSRKYRHGKAHVTINDKLLFTYENGSLKYGNNVLAISENGFAGLITAELASLPEFVEEEKAQDVPGTDNF